MYCARVNRFFKYAILSNLRNEMAKVYGEKKGRNYSVTVYYTISFTLSSATSLDFSSKIFLSSSSFDLSNSKKQTKIM